MTDSSNWPDGAPLDWDDYFRASRKMAEGMEMGATAHPDGWPDGLPASWSGYWYFSTDTRGNMAWWGPNILHPERKATRP